LCAGVRDCPASILTLHPVVTSFPENFGEPPKSRQRLVHHRIGVGGGVGAGFSEHEVHPARTDKKARVDCLVEHPLKGYLGEAALGFRIAAAHIGVTGKPDLLEVAAAYQPIELTVSHADKPGLADLRRESAIDP
jgi:hypothetical protein